MLEAKWWMSGRTEGWASRSTDMVYTLPMIPRGCTKHTTQFCSVLISIDPDAVTLLHLALGEGRVLHERILQKPKLTHVPRLFLPTLWRGGGVEYPEVKGSGLWSDWWSSDLGFALLWSGPHFPNL